MINVEDLLKPVSDALPCGEDFSYHPSLQSLETLSRGKAETQFSPAEEPQWKEVRDSAIEVLQQSKHLTPAIILTTSLLKIGGMDGLRDGTALVRGLVEKYWPNLYPKLDPDDNNDPTERLNILNHFSGPKFTAQVRELVICESPAMGRITLQQVITAKDKGLRPEGSPAPAGPDMNQIQAAFQDAGAAAATTMMGFVNESIANAQAIESFLDSTLGAGNGVNFEVLNKLLTEMKITVEPYAVGEPPPPVPASESSGGGPSPAAAPTRQQGLSGAIQSRADVIRALDMICDYYRDNEPSSPVPLIIQRAQRLVAKGFLEIVTDLTPDAVRQLEIITGTAKKE